MKLKHNKLKNTAIIFEVLSSKVLSEAIEGDSKIAIKLIKKHFNQNTMLYKELCLYNALLKSNKNLNESNFDLFVHNVIDSRKKLPSVLLKTSKYNLIKHIKSQYGEKFIKEGFSISLPKYKEMASVFKLFEYSASDNPTEFLESTSLIKETIITKTNVNEIQETKSEWASLPKEIRVVGFKKLIEKFNDKYKGMLPEQKNVLKVLINSPETLNSLIETEFKKISKKLNEVKVDDASTRIKLEQLSKLIVNLPTFKITDEHIAVVMKSYQLLKEI